MKEKYIKGLLENTSTLRTMFSLVWEDRENAANGPEETHPEWEKVEAAYTRICEGSSTDFHRDLWDVIECFSETYYTIGLRQGLESLPALLPVSNIVRNPFSKAEPTDCEIQPNADENQLAKLKDTIRKLREIDPSKEEFIQQIALKTEGFTVIKKSACDRVIDTLDEMIRNYPSQKTKE